MKSITFSYKDSCGVQISELAALEPVLLPEIERINDAKNKKYDTDYASLNLPEDKALHATIKKLVTQKKTMNPAMLIVIGIGGSNLGTMAVQQALLGQLYNEMNSALPIYYLDTIDTDHLHNVMHLLKATLQEGKAVIVNIISKSGTTIETIINAQTILDVLAQYALHRVQDYVVITTDKDSVLWQYAQQHTYQLLEIPSFVGGRYSVFSAVSLFPLALLGIDIDALCAGAAAMKDRCMHDDLFENPAAISAALLYTHYHDNITTHDTFLYDPALEGIGKWYRQLLAESIGKEVNRSKQLVHTGITPLVSIGSTDLHSMVQLYLAGPHDKFTTFVIANPSYDPIVIAAENNLAALIENIQGKTVSQVQRAIVHGVQAAYLKNKRPFVTLYLPEKSASYIGQLLQFKMLEIIYLGYLLDINPFDQPQVELYKKETREILAHE